MKNLFYTSPKYLQNLKGINSSASEIDNVVMLVRDVRNYGAKDDLSFDSRDAFMTAMNTVKEIYVPDTINGFYISSPIECPDGISIQGKRQVYRNLVRKAEIYAPLGFLLNSEENTKRDLDLKNLYIRGEVNTKNNIAVKGAFRGEIEGNYFRYFNKAIENNFSYLTNYTLNHFKYLNYGIHISSSNEVNIEKNRFDSDCITHIDSETLTPATTGNKDSAPLNILKNTFNFGSNSKSIIINAQANFKYNYAEVFSSCTCETLIKYVGYRSARSFLNFMGNHINGQNKVDRAIQIVGDSAVGVELGGMLKGNAIFNTNKAPLLLGGDVNYFNRILNYDILDNIEVEYQIGEYGSVSPSVALERTSSISIAGTSFVRIPMTFQAGSAGARLSDEYVFAEGGTFEIIATLTHQFIADYEKAETKLSISGVTVTSLFSSLKVIGTVDNYNSLALNALVTVSRGQTVGLFGANGDRIREATLLIKKVASQANFRELV